MFNKMILLIGGMLIACAVMAQKARPYLTVQSGLYKFKDTDPQTQSALSLGAHVKDMGIGLGAAITRFPGDSRVYIPVFVEMALLPEARKITPYGTVRFGTGGAYKSDPAIVQTTGKFFGSLQFGVGFPIARTGKILTGLGYQYAKFETSALGSRGYTIADSYRYGLNVFFGLSF